MTYCIGMAAVAAIWLGGKPAGYLARLGPAPLRFQAPARPADLTVLLPPLAMSDLPSAPEEFYGPPLPPPESLAPEPAPAPAPAPVAAAPVDQFGNLTPQMLIQFFNSSGTNQDYNVVVPFPFNPPVAPTIPPPPSSATYTTK